MTMALISALQVQFVELDKLKHGSMGKKIADFEHEKGCIAKIVERVEDARVQFEVCVVYLAFIDRSRILFLVAGHGYQNVSGGV